MSILRGKKGFKIVVARRILQLRRAVRTDTDRLRSKTIRRLEDLFDLASSFAQGHVKWQSIGGKSERVTVKQRQMWARIAAYIAQIMDTIANRVDERQIDKDLAELEKIVNEATAKNSASRFEEADGQEARLSEASG